jgi:hypothetical protein
MTHGHVRPITAVAAVLAALITGGAEAGPIPLTPPGLNPGDQFRFVFVTDGIRDATSSNIADYDSFVNAQAGGATYDGAVIDWIAIGSTDSVDAIDHVGQGNTPVFLSDGSLVAATTTAVGLWSGTIAHSINLDLDGNAVDPLFFVWTGTNPFGTGFGGPLGSPRPQTGSTTDILGAWVASGSSPGADPRHLYGISTVLTVPESTVPEPSMLTLLGTAIAIGSRYRRRR